ncbi:MAG: hypothetical protein ABL879_14680 [Devosia sp.]
MLFRIAAALIATALAALMMAPAVPASSQGNSILADLGLPTLIDTGSSLR